MLHVATSSSAEDERAGGGRAGGGEYRESRAEVNIGRHGRRQQGKPRVGTGGGSECWEVPAGEVSDDGLREARRMSLSRAGEEEVDVACRGGGGECGASGTGR